MNEAVMNDAVMKDAVRRVCVGLGVTMYYCASLVSVS